MSTGGSSTREERLAEAAALRARAAALEAEARDTDRTGAELLPRDAVALARAQEWRARDARRRAANAQAVEEAMARGADVLVIDDAPPVVPVVAPVEYVDLDDAPAPMRVAAAPDALLCARAELVAAPGADAESVATAAANVHAAAVEAMEVDEIEIIPPDGDTLSRATEAPVTIAGDDGEPFTVVSAPQLETRERVPYTLAGLEAAFGGTYTGLYPPPGERAELEDYTPTGAFLPMNSRGELIEVVGGSPVATIAAASEPLVLRRVLPSVRNAVDEMDSPGQEQSFAAREFVRRYYYGVWLTAVNRDTAVSPYGMNIEALDTDSDAGTTTAGDNGDAMDVVLPTETLDASIARAGGVVVAMETTPLDASLARGDPVVSAMDLAEADGVVAINDREALATAIDPAADPALADLAAGMLPEPVAMTIDDAAALLALMESGSLSQGDTAVAAGVMAGGVPASALDDEPAWDPPGVIVGGLCDPESIDVGERVLPPGALDLPMTEPVSFDGDLAPYRGTMTYSPDFPWHEAGPEEVNATNQFYEIWAALYPDGLDGALKVEGGRVLISPFNKDGATYENATGAWAELPEFVADELKNVYLNRASPIARAIADQVFSPGEGGEWMDGFVGSVLETDDHILEDPTSYFFVEEFIRDGFGVIRGRLFTIPAGAQGPGGITSEIDRVFDCVDGIYYTPFAAPAGGEDDAEAAGEDNTSAPPGTRPGTADAEVDEAELAALLAKPDRFKVFRETIEKITQREEAKLDGPGVGDTIARAVALQTSYLLRIRLAGMPEDLDRPKPRLEGENPPPLGTRLEVGASTRPGARDLVVSGTPHTVIVDGQSTTGIIPEVFSVGDRRFVRVAYGKWTRDDGAFYLHQLQSDELVDTPEIPIDDTAAIALTTREILPSELAAEITSRKRIKRAAKGVAGEQRARKRRRRAAFDILRPLVNEKFSPTAKLSDPSSWALPTGPLPVEFGREPANLVVALARNGVALEVFDGITGDMATAIVADDPLRFRRPGGNTAAIDTTGAAGATLESNFAVLSPFTSEHYVTQAVMRFVAGTLEDAFTETRKFGGHVMTITPGLLRVVPQGDFLEWTTGALPESRRLAAAFAGVIHVMVNVHRTELKVRSLTLRKASRPKFNRRTIPKESAGGKAIAEFKEAFQGLSREDAATKFGYTTYTIRPGGAFFFMDGVPVGIDSHPHEVGILHFEVTIRPSAAEPRAPGKWAAAIAEHERQIIRAFATGAQPRRLSEKAYSYNDLDVPAKSASHPFVMNYTRTGEEIAIESTDEPVSIAGMATLFNTFAYTNHYGALEASEVRVVTGWALRVGLGSEEARVARRQDIAMERSLMLYPDLVPNTTTPRPVQERAMQRQLGEVRSAILGSVSAYDVPDGTDTQRTIPEAPVAMDVVAGPA